MRDGNEKRYRDLKDGRERELRIPSTNRDRLLHVIFYLKIISMYRSFNYIFGTLLLFLFIYFLLLFTLLYSRVIRIVAKIIDLFTLLKTSIH